MSTNQIGNSAITVLVTEILLTTQVVLYQTIFATGIKVGNNDFSLNTRMLGINYILLKIQNLLQ